LITRRQVPFVEFKSTDTAISVPHVYLRCSNGRLEVRDISSGNGVHVQGRKIKGKEMVFNQEIFRIGRETEMQIITTISNIPEKIGDWIRQSWIGGGGMADVYRVQHKRDESIIRALKIPNPKKYRLNDKLGERYRELFERERNLSRKIHHSNLVLAHDDVGELEGSRLPYLVLDFIDGPSLDLLVEKLGTIAPNDVAEIVVQVGRAIKYLHAQHQHIHCDVKPGNILIDTSGQVFLSDLGIATPSGQNLPGLGVPDYLPREVIEGLPVGVDTDVYSLGQTMFHMLTAESLSKAQIEKRAGTQVINPIADPQKHSSAIITKLTQSSGARGALGQVIQRCIENKREKRYQRMDDLLQVVEPLCTGADLKALVAKSGWISSTS